MPCLVCPQFNCTGIRRPLEGHVLAPFVQIGFSGDGQFITVGNNSSPPNNHAVIKSFEYGLTEGQGMKCEIFDEDGGDFTKFTEKLSKTLSKAPQDYQMIVDFGWIVKKCGETTPTVISVKNNGGRLTFLPLSIDVAYEQGKLKFSIEGSDFMDRIAENCTEDNQGSEDHKKPLKQAIEDLLKDNDPAVARVRYVRADLTEPWNFPNADNSKNGDGPKSVWTCDQQNALATIRKWISPLRTEDNKGIIMEWNCANKNSEAELILWEGPPPDGRGEPCCQNSIGTYIVNGGKCSPVISFNPTLNWKLFNNNGSGGQSGGASDGGQPKVDGAEGSQVEKVGNATSAATGNTDDQWRSKPLIVPLALKADAAHAAATELREVKGSIEADLKIQGDPSLSEPPFMHGKDLALIVINPFHIKRGSTACGEWLAEPPCSRLFSNKRWLIKGVNHSIQEGNYVTTLKIQLPTQNNNLNPNEPLGGCPGGKRFNNANP